MRARGFVGPAVAGLVVAAYAASLRRYGIFDPTDEGLLLVQAWRAAQGQVPYLDFHTGYGPLHFRLQALLVAAGGIAAVRWALVAVHAAAGALLYALARRLAGPGLALAAVALEIAFFLPVAPARGAPFNAPYPAWYAGLGGVLVVLLLGPGRRDLARLGLCGVVCGIVAAMKPSSGVLLALGGAAAIALEGGRLGTAVLVAVASAALVLVWPGTAPLAAVVLVPPLLALVWLGGTASGDDRRMAARLAVLGAGFAPVAGAAYLPFLLRLGPGRFAREVLLLGAGVAEVYALPFPWPAALAAAAGVLAFAGRTRAAIALAIAALGVLGVDSLTRDEQSTVAAIRHGAELAALAGVPLVVWAALAALRRDRALAAPTAVAAAGVLQLYPRADFLHLMPLGVLLLPLALRAWRTAASRLPALAIALPLALAVARFLPTATVLSHLATGRVVPVDLGSDRLVVEAEGSLALRAIAAAAADVRSRWDDGPVVTFPACGIVPFVAGRLPAGPHDYFFPGRPDRAEGAALAARLAAAPPRLAVACSAADTGLAAAWNYYPELTALLRTRYEQRVSHPPYFLLERR